MRVDAFFNRLNSGKSVGMQKITADEYCCVIEICRYQDKFVMTWEEFHKDHFYNEHLYRVDEIYNFRSVLEAAAFLRSQGIHLTDFWP